jgi:hypothetical protein
MTQGGRSENDLDGGLTAAVAPSAQAAAVGPAPQAPVTTPRYSVRRVACGIWWAIGTLVCAISVVTDLAAGKFLPALLVIGLTALLGWYDYRIWTFRAKWLMFLIIF